MPQTERRAIVMGVTGSHAFAAGAVLAGLGRHVPGLADDLVLFHDGLTAAQMDAFRRMHGRVTFLPFGMADLCARLGMAADDPALRRVLAKVHPMALAKLDMPRLLATHDRCVWLDADMLVCGDWRGIWDFGALAWRPLPEGAMGRRADVFRALPDLAPVHPVPLPNGGVVGLSRQVPPDTGPALWALARRLLRETRAVTLDELALHLFAATRGVAVTPLPLALNHPVDRAGVRDAVLVHAIGPHKFWNAAPLRQMWPAWRAHQADWVAAGGEAYAGPVTLADVHPEDPGEAMRAIGHRAAWLAFHESLRPELPKGLQVDPRLDGGQMRLTFAGLPPAQHIRLAMSPNPRRIVLDLRLPGPEAEAALAALRHAAGDLRPERGHALSLPRERLAQALRAVAAAVLAG